MYIDDDSIPGSECFSQHTDLSFQPAAELMVTFFVVVHTLT
jgi:hypothetical protein